MTSSHLHLEREDSCSSSSHADLFSSLTSLRELPASYIRSRAWRSTAHSNPSLWRDLDRVQVLGDEKQSGYGHTGCVNALSWSRDGEILISSGDDHRLCVWRPPTSFSTTSNIDEFSCSLTLQTGHTGNVFAAHFLPYTTHIATCAADRQVRVFDVTRTIGGTSRPMHVSSLEAAGNRERNWEERSEGMCCLKVLRCHKRKAKRIVTEDSPNFFLTVSEDHTVRQHDLRTSHTCGPNGSCPAPIVKLPYSLSTLACSPVTPWYFVVAGESVFGHLFDRRMVGRILRLEWGQNIIDDDEDENSTRCVRRFGRLKRGPKELKGSSHITAARMAKTNGHELLLSYSGDAAYLYNIRDTPFEPPRRQPSIVLPNKPSSTSRSSHKKPASPSSPISSSKRRKIENERSVSPTWASAPTTNQQGPSRLEAVDEGNDKALLNGNTAAEWSGVEGQGDPSGTGDEDEIPVVDSNDIRSQTLETSESGAAAEGSPYVNGEEEQSQAQETQDGDGSEGGGENENEDNSGEDEGDSEDEDEDEDEDGDDDDFVDREEGEDDTEEAGYVQESNGGAAWDTLNTPIVMPNKRFAGARNVETYKDVNFLGASDDYVCSGSDDGHFFLWSKAMTKLVGIWEGDGSVVNVIEDRPAHHSFPMLAVSGIDHTVKLFAPTPSEPRPFCHTSRAAEIVRANSIRAAPRMMRLSRMQMALLQAHLGLEGGDTNREDCCIM